jgi:hypothetical protein
MEKGKKQLTGEQGWSHAAEGIGGDGSVGGTSGDGGMMKKRHEWLRWRDEEEAWVAVVASRGRQKVAEDEKKVAALGQSNGAAAFVTKDTRKIEERRMAPADRSEKRTRSALQTIDRTHSSTDQTR